MREPKRRSLLFIVLVGILSCLARAQSADGVAIIQGHVYDHAGKPVAGAKVFPFPLQSAISGLLPSALTDEEGRYVLTSPAFGLTRICAAKEGSGYPDTSDSVFLSGKEKQPELNLSPAHTYSQTDIYLPEPDITISGVVRDESTGQELKNIRIVLKRADAPENFYSIGQMKATFTFDLPPRKILMQVYAPDHTVWTRTLELVSGPQHQELVVNMKASNSK